MIIGAGCDQTVNTPSVRGAAPETTSTLTSGFYPVIRLKDVFILQSLHLPFSPIGRFVGAC